MTATSRTWNRLSLVTMGLGVAALIAAVALFIVQAVQMSGEAGKSGPQTGTGFNARAILETTPVAAPTPTGVPPSSAPISRLVIPKIAVDALVVIKGVNPDGVMQAPDGPWDVAWYSFSARPGFVGNAVFSGHVDYVNVGPAVFWDLGQLEMDDVIEVRLEDGAVYQYRVVAKDAFEYATAPIERIVGPTANQSLTIITCTGTFDSSSRQYDQRLVIRAELIPPDAPPAPPPESAARG